MTDDRDLPAMIDWCVFRLRKARTSGEVLEVRALATAAFHRAKLVKASHQVQADCLRIIDRTEKLIGKELIGQVKHPGGRPSKNLSIYTTGYRDRLKLSDLGITRDQSAAWQRRAETPDEVVEKAIQDQIDADRRPTKQTVNRAVQTYHKTDRRRFGIRQTKQPNIGKWTDQGTLLRASTLRHYYGRLDPESRKQYLGDWKLILKHLDETIKSLEAIKAQAEEP